MLCHCGHPPQCCGNSDRFPWSRNTSQLRRAQLINDLWKSLRNKPLIHVVERESNERNVSKIIDRVTVDGCELIINKDSSMWGLVNYQLGHLAHPKFCVGVIHRSTTPIPPCTRLPACCEERRGIRACSCSHPCRHPWLLPLRNVLEEISRIATSCARKAYSCTTNIRGMTCCALARNHVI